jgi:hypothetical protein
MKLITRINATPMSTIEQNLSNRQFPRRAWKMLEHENTTIVFMGSYSINNQSHSNWNYAFTHSRHKL